MKFGGPHHPPPCAFNLADQFRWLAHTWLRQRYQHHLNRRDYHLAGHYLLLDGHVIQTSMSACADRAYTLLHDASTLQCYAIERSLEILDAALIDQPPPDTSEQPSRLRLACLPLLFLSLPLATGFGTSAFAAPHRTPEITTIEGPDRSPSVARVLRAQLGTTQTYVGLAFLCNADKPYASKVTAYFGPFPTDARPVQLAVRNRHGKIERFGPAVRGTPRSGFHSPRVTQPADLRRLTEIALQPGSLISNGYTSFWNRVPANANHELRHEFLRCLNPTPSKGPREP